MKVLCFMKKLKFNKEPQPTVNPSTEKGWETLNY